MVLAYLRILLLFFLLATGFAVVVLIVDWIFGHKLLIPIARVLKFKIDDVKKTQKKVDGILGDSVAKKSSKKRKKT